MSIASLTQDIMGILRDHNGWVLPAIFVLAFGESLAFVSLLLPATVILLAAGALIAELNISFLAAALAAAGGAFFGDWFSFLFARRYRQRIHHFWPFRRYPDLLPRGEAFFSRWGDMSVFFGRFLGPLRATVPLIAGMCHMSFWRFQLANLSSALIWGGGILAPGALGLSWLKDFW